MTMLLLGSYGKISEALQEKVHAGTLHNVQFDAVHDHRSYAAGVQNDYIMNTRCFHAALSAQTLRR